MMVVMSLIEWAFCIEDSVPQQQWRYKDAMRSPIKGLFRPQYLVIILTKLGDSVSCTDQG
jgi:hypothetical protein